MKKFISGAFTTTILSALGAVIWSILTWGINIDKSVTANAYELSTQKQVAETRYADIKETLSDIKETVHEVRDRLDNRK